jgi:hypothetical protein
VGDNPFSLLLQDEFIGLFLTILTVTDIVSLQGKLSPLLVLFIAFNIYLVMVNL